MPHPFRRSFVPLLAAACLSACGSAEDRINAAVPVAKAVDDAHAAITAMRDEHADAVEAVEQEYRSRLKVRAITCAAGHEPAWYAGKDSIRASVGNASCFVDADTALARWLGLRRVALLAGLPALRPIPKTPAVALAGEPGLDRYEFAAAAGVAALQWKGHVRIVDVGTGEALHDEDVGLHGGLSLSANGRVLAVGGEDLVQVRASDTGELLLTLPDVRGGQVQWLGNDALAYAQADGAHLAVLELASGRETTLPFAGSALSGAFAATGAPGTFVLVTPRRIVQLAMTAGNPPQLVGELPSPSLMYSSDAVAPGPDGLLPIASNTDLLLLDPASFAQTTVSFAPMRLLRALPTGDGDHLLLAATSGYRGATYVYSRRDRTLATVDAATGASRAGRLAYVPALRRLATIDDAAVVFTKVPDAGVAQPLDDVLTQLAFDEAIARNEQEARRAALLDAYAQRAQATGTPQAVRTPTPVDTAPARARSGKDGLVDALNAGVLRVGSEADLEAWKRLYEGKVGHAVPERFDSFTRHTPVYVITRAFTIPDNLTGAASATFVLERGAPYPHGENQHSAILDMKSGGCTGNFCSFLLSRD